METDSYHLETTFLPDRDSVCHTTRHASQPPTTIPWRSWEHFWGPIQQCGWRQRKRWSILGYCLRSNSLGFELSPESLNYQLLAPSAHRSTSWLSLGPHRKSSTHPHTIHTRQRHCTYLMAPSTHQNKPLSFSMFDIVDVLDVSKTTIWWSAKDKSGQRGWVPSNYFVVIEHTSIPRRPPRTDPPSTDLGSGYSILPVWR